MRTALLITMLSGILASCASLPVRDFRADYQKASGRWVNVAGYAPFNVAELRNQRRIKVQLTS